MSDLHQLLAGGDRRSIGRVTEAVTLVLGSPSRFDQLIDGMVSPDPVVRMRCADAAEKVTAVRPDLLLPHRHLLIDRLSASEQQEVRWHVAPMLLRLPLTDDEEDKVMGLLIEYSRDRSRIVRTTAMQAMADLAFRSARFVPEVLTRIEALTATGTPAMRARGRRLLHKLACINGAER